MSTILHITARQAWQAAQSSGAYVAPSLDSEGFIHCSTAEQVERVANSFYRGQNDLVLLRIETERLTATLKWEAPVQSSDPHNNLVFPHVYGPINIDAVEKVVEFLPDASGTFTLPEL
ncbi:MAG: DUF952 domain-containing protein [Anaerolineae bacterium]